MNLPSVNLCVLCTGRYRPFLWPLLESARMFFCAEFPRTFHVWMDEPLPWPEPFAKYAVPISPHYLAHEPWPGVTLHRYQTFVAAKETLLATGDFTFYCDVDMRFVGHVGEEILSHLTATRHPGYVNSPVEAMTYERRRNYAAYVPVEWRYRYYAGGFQGGRTQVYLQVAAQLAERIRVDESAGRLAWWADESHWNWYLASHRPFDSCVDGRPKELSPDYCTTEGFETPTTKIVALNKNHAQIRSQ